MFHSSAEEPPIPPVIDAECPVRREKRRVYIMYHATDAGNVPSILREGFRPSTEGMLGPGVYASRDINKTLAYGNEDGRRVVLKLLVFTGKVKRIVQQGDPGQYSWHGEFDTAWVPPGCGEFIYLSWG